MISFKSILLHNSFKRSLALALLLCVSQTEAETLEQQAKITMDSMYAAMDKKDVKQFSSFLTDHCIILLTEPHSGPKQARLFSKVSYLAALAKRFSALSGGSSTAKIQSVTVTDYGDVFVTVDSESRSRIGERNESIRSQEYFVLGMVDGRMLIKLIVAELRSYVPNIPPDGKVGNNRMFRSPTAILVEKMEIVFSRPK